MIQNLVFDLGGVIITLDFEQAVRRFYDMGVENIRTYLDPFAQSGIFGDLESGKISAEEFREKLSALAGCDLTCRLPLCLEGLCSECATLQPRYAGSPASERLSPHSALEYQSVYDVMGHEHGVQW